MPVELPPVEHRYFVPDETAPTGSTSEPVEEEVGPEVELAGIRRIKFGAAAGIAGLVLGVLTPIVVLFYFGVGLSLGALSSSPAAVLFTAVEMLLVSLLSGLALLIASAGLYLSGFGKLRRVDGIFSTPMGLSVIGVIGLGIVLAFVGILVAQIVQVLSCGGVGVATASCLTLSSITLSPDLVLVGFLLAFIGWIGMLIGLYRFGRRYGSTVTRVGAILYAIPVAGIVSPILILLGAHSVEKTYFPDGA